MLPNVSERRKHFRLSYRIPMRYRKIEPHAPEFKGSLMKNISAGGGMVTTPEFLALNLKLAIEIALASGKKPVKGICRVAWVKKTASGEQYDTGVQFVDLEQGDEIQISKFIFSNADATGAELKI